MNRKELILTSMVFFFLLIAVIIFADQVYYWNKFFEPSDFWHHENLALLAIAFSVGIIVTWIILKNKNNPRKRN